MSNSLILGDRGRMGRRYSAIFRYLKIPFDRWDISTGDPLPALSQYEYALICTPTDTHIEWIKRLRDSRVEFVLCEKPICMSSTELDGLELGDTHLCVVNNWSFAHRDMVLLPGSCVVDYSNWYTGPHGGVWDGIQLHYLDKRGLADISEGPVFRCRINSLPVTLSDIDESYVRMIHTWRDNPDCWTNTDLWNINDIAAQTKICERIINERDRNPSSFKLDAPSR